MYKNSIFIVAIGLFYTACTPKTGTGVASTPSPKVEVKAPKMQAPTIPIPTGANVRATSPQPGTPPSIQVGKAGTSTLANGIKVIVVENHKLPTVSFQLYIDKDPVLEKNAAGYVEMMGSLLSKGTTTRSKSDIDKAVDFLGASMSSSASGVNGDCLSKHSEALLSIMSDVLLHPAFPVEEFEKSKKQAASGLAQAKEDPSSISSNVRQVLTYGKDHPYGEVMTEKSLENINIDLMRSYYSTYFKPNNAYFVVVGDVTPVQANAWAKKYFGTWATGATPKNAYPQPKAPSKTTVDFVNKAGAVQSVINISYPIDLQPKSDDAIKAQVMNTLLGGYFNSRVNANLREGHAYTYGARTSLSPDERIGAFNASASVRNEVTDSSILQFMYELNRLRTEPVPEAELALVKNVMTGSFARSLETPETVARFALNTARYGLAADYYETYLAKLAMVSVADIQAMAKKYIQPDKAHIIVVGSKDESAKNLGQFGKIQYYDVSGNPLEDMSSSIPSELSGPKVIQDYINAIGGKNAIQAVKDINITGTMEGMGMPIAFTSAIKEGGKMLMEITMNGQVLNKQVVNGNKAMTMGMGQEATEVSGDELAELKTQALLFKEGKYESLGYDVVLSGADVFDGKKAFVVVVTTPNGVKHTEYYAMSDGLKLAEVSTQSDGEESMTITTAYSKYEAVNGVMIPKLITLSGAFPVPMKMMVQEAKINSNLDDALFSW